MLFIDTAKKAAKQKWLLWIPLDLSSLRNSHPNSLTFCWYFKYVKVYLLNINICTKVSLLLLLFFFNLHQWIPSPIASQREWKGGRKKNINRREIHRFTASCLHPDPARDRVCNQGTCPWPESIQDPSSVRGPMLPLSITGQGCTKVSSIPYYILIMT